MERIAILGGTFNPVHNQHVALAKAAVSELKLDKLIVMPTYLSPHKKMLPIDGEHRLNMLKLAFQGMDKIEVSDFEILKQGKSYTYLTVERFKKEYGGKLYFIVGGDMLSDFKTWRYPNRILEACTLAAFGRDDFYTDYNAEIEYFEKTFKKSFERLSYQGKSASSTQIRVYSAFGMPLDGLTDKKVELYIKEHGLYAGDQTVDYVKRRLPPKRLKHTADVVCTALKKAKELGLSEDKVFTACALHDCAKYVDEKDVEGFIREIDVPQPVVHAFLGEYICRHQLKITDEEILDAIKYHTSGKPDMSTLAKLVFVADMIEPGRDYEGVEELRALYEKQDFEECFRKCLQEEVQHLLNKKQYIYKATLDAYDYYLKERK